MKILLIGGGYVNKGAEAMSLTVKRELSQRLSNTSFVMEVRSSRLSEAYVQEAKREGITPLRVSTSLSKRLRSMALQAVKEAGRVSEWFPYRNLVCEAKIIADSADAFIDISGYAYADKWGPKKAREMNFVMREAQRQNKPYVIMPQTWGPFSDNELYALCRDSCRRADRFYARDRQSRTHLADLLGKPLEEVPLAPDIAFAFEPAGLDEVSEFLESKGLDPSQRPTIAVAPNMRVYERSQGIGSNNDYVNVLINTCRSFLDKGVDTLLVPHEIKVKRQGSPDDRLICNIVETALRHNQNAKIVAQEEVMSARMSKALIGSCDLLLGSRFHSIVAALSQAVPAVAIGWSFKYQELMRDFDLDAYVVDYTGMEVPEVIEMAHQAWKEREMNEFKIAETLPGVKKRVCSLLDEVAELI